MKQANKTKEEQEFLVKAYFDFGFTFDMAYAFDNMIDAEIDREQEKGGLL